MGTDVGARVCTKWPSECKNLFKHRTAKIIYTKATPQKNANYWSRFRVKRLPCGVWPATDHWEKTETWARHMNRTNCLCALTPWLGSVLKVHAKLCNLALCWISYLCLCQSVAPKPTIPAPNHTWGQVLEMWVRLSTLARCWIRSLRLSQIHRIMI